MSKLAPIALTNIGTGSTTLNLVPAGVNPTTGVARLSEDASAPATEKFVTISVTPPKKKGANYVVSLRVANPTVDTTKPHDPKIVRVARAEITVRCSPLSTKEERQLLRTEIAALLKDPLLIDAIDGLNPAY